MISPTRSFAVLVVAAAALLSPGCCSRFDRGDSRRSFAFLTSSISRHTQDDARVTGAVVTGLPEAARRHWNHSMNQMGVASDRYCGE